MKNILFFSITLVTIFLFSCEDKCTTKNQYTYYEPVYLTSSEIKASTRLEGSREIENPGKIYIKGALLLVNEVGKGIHLIDNSDAKSPQSISFLSIPGNNDMAILGNTLYADSYSDLVAFDISSVANIHEVSRIESFLDPHQFYFYNEVSNSFVTDWIKKDEVTVYESECESLIQPWGGIMYESGIAMPFDSFAGSAKSSIAPSNGAGKGGSTARFTINREHLYVLDLSNLKVVDISSEQNPVSKGMMNLSWDIETIFPYDDKLFVGSQTGMYIVSVSDPEHPQTLSVYSHLRSCDPVVVEGNYAYVTLRDGNTCAGALNQLEVLDIEDPSNPLLLATYPMTNPHGLGIDGSTLFICDGRAGLKIYEASDPLAIDRNPIAHYKDIHSVDIIPFNKKAILIGESGLVQYDYSNIKDIKLLSTIPFSK
ncbi:MAG: hypothetical protein WAU36_03980 [Cyclobacteriaceae bacterium]